VQYKPEASQIAQTCDITDFGHALGRVVAYNVVSVYLYAHALHPPQQ
jgi:hypothetical protein